MKLFSEFKINKSDLTWDKEILRLFNRNIKQF